MPKKTLGEKCVAYFSAEFGIDSNTPTYAGGLGILAGDTLKEAADRDYPMIGIGLLYQGKRFIQRINSDGWQTEEVSLYDPASACLRQVTTMGEPMYVIAKFDSQDVYIKAYQIRVGEKTTLYLLSSDSHKNSDEWRNIMAADYWGDAETQLRQQLVLGVGGMMLLEKLKIKPEVYHYNEGRPCFATWELISQIMKKDKLSFEEANKIARSKTVYTNHTILSSGNLLYNADLIRKYAHSIAQNLGIETEKLISDGLVSNSNDFSISQYSLKNANKANSVSKRHLELCETEWPEFSWINITNGVHLPSWQNTHFRDPNLSDSQIWNIHSMRKHELMKTVERRVGFGYDQNMLVISWARRMAGYKNLGTLFADFNKLEKILKKQDKPVLLLIAGKAHPGDDEAKRHIQTTIKHMQQELAGHAIFVPNYDIALARAMVSGSDVWLNTPEYGKEACGTSGMKAISNGVLNCTVADGWAAEVEWEKYGWALDHNNLSQDFYKILEEQIAPLYYSKNQEGLPLEWIQKMKASLALAKNYSTERMLDQYTKLLY